MKKSRRKLGAALLCSALLFAGCSTSAPKQEEEPAITQRTEGPLASLLYRYFDITTEFYTGGYSASIYSRTSIPQLEGDVVQNVENQSIQNDVTYTSETRILRMQEDLQSSDQQNMDLYTCTELDGPTLYTVNLTGDGTDAVVTAMDTQKDQPEYDISAALEKQLTAYFGMSSTMDLFADSTAFSYDTEVDKENNTQTTTVTLRDAAAAQSLLEATSSMTVTSLFNVSGFDDPTLSAFTLIITTDQNEVIRDGALSMEVNMTKEGETYTASYTHNLTLLYPDEMSLTGMADMFYDMENGKLQDGDRVTLISQ